MNFTYQNQQREFDAEISERSFHWGKGLTVKIFDTDGSIYFQIGFICHPEFLNYEQYQQMTIEELSHIVIDRINRGECDDEFNENIEFWKSHKITASIIINR